ncbi:unnamed protein product [Euphydryas editha]|uniref:Endonuclease-reverse transcriptase n=1 Tax=Euphydryas editha TaxID=104508 RepID=A0AAU9UC79_EUPED|nr:unnamed protein product [Euphydryas editha]
MEEIMKILHNIQQDLTHQKRYMKDMEENIKEAINKNIDDKFNQIEIKTNQLEQKIEAQQKTIDFIDKQMRKRNIIFFGVPELEKNYEDLLRVILEVINEKMNVICQNWEIETVARLGKNKGKIRPVVVTMTTTSRKLQILKNRKALENTSMYIKEDYTPAVLQKRKELQGELQRRRLSGEKVMLRHDKIVNFKSQKEIFYTPKGASNKRSLSESPGTEIIQKLPNNEEQTKQIPKKNKSQNITSFLRPSQFNNVPKPSTSREHQEPQKN